MADVDVTDASMADLVQRLSQQTATLVRQEMHLAQAELKQKGKRAGMGTDGSRCRPAFADQLPL